MNYQFTVKEDGTASLELGEDDRIDLKIEMDVNAFEKLFLDGIEAIRASRGS